MYKFIQHIENTLNPLTPSTPTLSRARILTTHHKTLLQEYKKSQTLFQII